MLSEIVVNLTEKVALINVKSTKPEAQEDFEILMETIISEF
jgi:hypothetical protein